MKSKFIPKPDEERTYPYVGKSRTGNVVLFSAPKVGIVLVSNEEQFSVGHHCVHWSEWRFEPVEGTIEITCP